MAHKLAPQHNYAAKIKHEKQNVINETEGVVCTSSSKILLCEELL